MSNTNAERPFQVDAWHQIAFDAMSAGSGNFGLVPCRIGDEGSACICMARETGRGGMEVMPLFVAITPGLDLILPHRGEADGESGGGGPKRGAARAFAAAAVTATRG